MPGRSYTGDGYRYGFNGKEYDKDWDKGGATYDYGFRIYDPRIGKFLSVDPLYVSFPYNSPYLYADNSPIVFIDEMGLRAVRPGGGGTRGTRRNSSRQRNVGGNPISIHRAASEAAAILRNKPTQISFPYRPVRPGDIVRFEHVNLGRGYRPPSSEPYNTPRMQLAELGEDRMTPISKDILTTIVSAIDQLSNEIESFTIAKSYLRRDIEGDNGSLITKDFYTGSDLILDMSTSLRIEALDQMYFAEVDKIARGNLSEEEFNSLSISDRGFRNISAKFQLGLQGIQQPSIEIANRLLAQRGEVTSVETKELPQLRRGK